LEKLNVLTKTNFIQNSNQSFKFILNFSQGVVDGGVNEAGTSQGCGVGSPVFRLREILLSDSGPTPTFSCISHLKW